MQTVLRLRVKLQTEEAFMDLSTLRNEIDRIDSQLVQLYEQRMEICSQVAEYKIENGKKVFDKTREEEKLARESACFCNLSFVFSLYASMVSLPRSVRPPLCR